MDVWGLPWRSRSAGTLRLMHRSYLVWDAQVDHHGHPMPKLHRWAKLLCKVQTCKVQTCKVQNYTVFSFSFPSSIVYACLENEVLETVCWTRLHGMQPCRWGEQCVAEDTWLPKHLVCDCNIRLASGHWSLGARSNVDTDPVSWKPTAMQRYLNPVQAASMQSDAQLDAREVHLGFYLGKVRWCWCKVLVCLPRLQQPRCSLCVYYTWP